ncbi:CocE/NonD family hydrolase [Streptomyces sp. NPDC012769]|uniref:CocE/NonD family hydrolase n=1 Tax=Streptomyces sp. NPDC012769 TaxID=3364848 RepID=UPI0036741FD5
MPDDHAFSSFISGPLTDADVARVADHGIWGPDGTLDPDAARLGRTLAAALADETRSDLLTDELAELVTRVRAIAVPAFPRVETTDGIRLSAFTLRQLAPGPHPLVVMPAGWTPLGWSLFMYAYLTLAAKGYHVIAYTPRGLGIKGLPSTSPGFIDVAGPHDWADGSAVIDHAVEHFAPSTIGFMGESYGSGISQLVAAHDDRVQAVVALSTWGNLADCLYGNDVRHIAAVAALLRLTGGPAEEKFDGRNRAILADFQAGTNMPAVADWGILRSPQSYLDLTNENGTPTFFSHTWHEGLFAANQVVDTFEGLRVPKRLNMWIGDHAVPEGSGLVAPPARPGDVNIPLQEAYAWLDHHLKGERNGVEDWPEVSNQIMFTYRTVPVRDPESGRPVGEHWIVEPARRESHARWSDVTTGIELLALTAGGAGGADGALVPVDAVGADAAGADAGRVDGGGAEPSWERAFIAGVDTEATAMDALMETGQAEWSGNPKTYDTRKFDRTHALVWTTAPLTGPAGSTAARRVRGIPRLSLTVRSTARSATLVAHLFDVAEDDTARIITHEPLNLDELTPGQDREVSWRLQAAAYDIPEGHRLMLVIDSKDPLYGDVSVVWTQTVVSSSEGAAAVLELPLG